MQNKHKIEDSSKLFFTADTHFGHTNIIKYTDRPFESTHDMNKAMIDGWNSVVSKDDIVYHLGDFAYRNKSQLDTYTSQLNGTIHLVLGNHDKQIRGSEYNRKKFASVSDMLVLTVSDKEVDAKEIDIVLCHYPFLTWFKAYYGSWNLFGHVHGSLKGRHSPNQLDVGVDVHNFKPISYEDVKVIITKQNLNK